MEHELRLFLDTKDYNNLIRAFKIYRPNAIVNEINLLAYANFLLGSISDQALKEHTKTLKKKDVHADEYKKITCNFCDHDVYYVFDSSLGIPQDPDHLVLKCLNCGNEQ